MTGKNNNAENLIEAARANSAELCAQYYGKAENGNIFVNAKALRTAAENQSYEAFEQMLEISGNNACGIASVTSVGLGEDWTRVGEIAQTDVRINAALEKYDSQVDKNIDSMLSEINTNRRNPVSGIKGFFKRFSL